MILVRDILARYKLSEQDIDAVQLILYSVNACIVNVDYKYTFNYKIVTGYRYCITDKTADKAKKIIVKNFGI